MTRPLLRAALAAALLGAALAAQAVTIGLTSAGTLGVVNQPNDTIDETVLLQQGGFGPLSTLHIDYLDQAAPPISGAGTYSGAGGTLSFSFTFNTLEGAGSGLYAGGVWTATGGGRGDVSLPIPTRPRSMGVPPPHRRV